MKKIVVCGSMQFFCDMENCKTILNNHGFDVILPKPGRLDDLSPGQVQEYRRNASKRHFHAIADADTYAILVVNQTKNSVTNYIGASTFAEIAVAFFFDKKIFLLNDIYPPYADELLGWGVIPLKGDLNALVLKQQIVK